MAKVDWNDHLLVPCEGGPLGGGWLRVGAPAPLEVDRGFDGLYVLDDQRSAGDLAYIYVQYRI